MSVREYIGARYVPLFADPIEWDNTKTYEPLTIVYYQGNSYTSRQAVPTGIAITNEDYWALTGNYNAQIEAYRTEVQNYADAMDDIIDTVDDVVAEIGTGFDSQNTVSDAIGDEETARIAAISAEETARIAADSALQQQIISRTNDSTIIWIGDSWGVYNDGELPANVAKGLNSTLKNYSVNGVGFIYGSSNFSAQVNQAINDSTITNPDAVKYVVLYGLSNDMTHNYTSASDFTNPIKTMVQAIKTKFTNAVVHIFFNNRWRFGETVYTHQNPQIKLANNIFNNLSIANVDAIIHPDSIAWLSKDSFDSDLIHPIDTFGYAYLTQFVLASIIGGTIDPFYTNVSSILLGNGVSGRLTVVYNNRQITIEAYVILESTLESAAIVARGKGLFPVQLFENASVGQGSNQLCISLGKAEGRGEIKMPIQFNANSNNEDLVYALPTLTTDSASAGTYWGSITFRMF